MMDSLVVEVEVEVAPHQAVMGAHHHHHHIETVHHGKEDQGDQGEMEDLEDSGDREDQEVQVELEDQEVQAAMGDHQDHHHRPGKVGQMI